MADNITKIILSGEDRTAGMFSNFQRNLSAAETASNGLKSALGALGLTLTAAGFASLIKGAIDAADHLNDLSKSTGLAATQIGALGYAGKTAGVGLDEVAKGLGKLAKNMYDGAPTFAALGVSIKDSTGHLKSSEEVFLSVADKFAGMEDGAGKAALAQKIFGKSGAELIPLLNEGARGIAEMTEEYHRYSGMTADLAENSDAFNDKLEKLKMMSGGLANQIAAELLPTMDNLALAMLDYKENTASAEKISAALSVTIQSITAVGMGAIHMFVQAAGTAGALAAAAVEAAKFNFSLAAKIIAEDKQSRLKADADFARQIDTLWAKSTDSMRTWTEKQKNYARDAAIVQAAYLTYPIEIQQKAMKALADSYFSPNKTKGPVDNSGDSAKKTVDDYARITQSIAKLTAEISAEDAALAPLLKSEKLALDLMVDIGTGKTKLTTAQKISTVAALEEAIAKEKLGVATKKSAKERELEQKALADENVSRWKTIDALDTEIKSLQISGEEIGLSVEKLNALKLARMDAAIATKEHTLAVAEATAKGGSNIEALKIEIEQIKRIRDLTASNQGRQAAADIAKINLDEQVGMWRSIEKTAHDTFVSIANGGKDTWTRLKETGKNIFFDWLYQMTLKKWLINIAASVGGTGGAAYANTMGGAASGGSSLVSMGGNGMSMPTLALTSWSGMANSTAFGANSAGSYLYDAGYQSSGSYLMENASAIGDYASMAGQTLSYASALYAASEGKWGQAIGTAVGAYFFGPLGSAIGGYLGGWVDEYFGGGGGPKVEGGATRGINSDGSLSAFSVGMGGDRGDLGYSNNSGINQVLGVALQDLDTFVTKLGGSAAGLNASLSYITDPQGDSPDMVSSSVTNAAGKTIYSHQDSNLARDSYKASLELESKRLLIAGVQASEGLDSIFHAIITGIGDIGAATTTTIDAALAHIADAFNVLSYGTADPLADVMKQIERDATTVHGAWQINTTALNTLISAYDGSAAATKTLAAATQGQYQLELQLIGQIQNALTSTQGMFGNSIESIRMSVMDDPAKYDYLRTQADSLYTQLSTATDPAKIQALADKINNDINSAYGLLDAGQKQGAAGDFVTYLEKVDTLTTDRLTLQQDQVTQNHKDLAEKLTAKMDEAAANLAAAAAALQAAASTPPPPAQVSVSLFSTLGNEVGMAQG